MGNVRDKLLALPRKSFHPGPKKLDFFLFFKKYIHRSLRMFVSTCKLPKKNSKGNICNQISWRGYINLIRSSLLPKFLEIELFS